MKKLMFGVLTCTLLGGALLLGMDATEGAEDSPRAKAILGEAGRFLAEQPHFTVEMDMDYQLKVDGETESLPTHYTLSIERPGRLALAVKNEEIEIHFFRDEESLTVYIPAFEQYTVEAASEEPSTVLRRTGFGPFSLVIPLVAEFAKQNSFEIMLSESATASYTGEEAVGGVDCHRIRLSHDGLKWDVWIEAGDQPVLRRIVPDTAEFVKEMKASGFSGALSVDALFGAWAFEGKPEVAFAFNAPKGTKKVDAFQPPPPKPRAYALLGKPAPEFAIDILDGGTFNLAEVKGKEIIILDFWATWCGPCRMAMPMLERVAKRFADRDVRLYAVNVSEDVASVRRYLSKQKLDLTTLLDKTGAVGAQYMAESIPQTVIIGKDGTVQVVHVGYSGSLENTIAQELTALAKGEKLAD